MRDILISGASLALGALLAASGLSSIKERRPWYQVVGLLIGSFGYMSFGVGVATIGLYRSLPLGLVAVMATSLPAFVDAFRGVSLRSLFPTFFGRSRT